MGATMGVSRLIVLRGPLQVHCWYVAVVAARSASQRGTGRCVSQRTCNGPAILHAGALVGLSLSIISVYAALIASWWMRSQREDSPNNNNTRARQVCSGGRPWRSRTDNRPSQSYPHSAM